MKPNRMVLDLSHHEKVQSYDLVKADGIYGIIYKATQGKAYTDPTYYVERDKWRRAGMLWGSYHFADKSPVESQITNYLEYAQPQADELFCLDLEDYGSNSMTLSQARAFVEGVESELGRPGECVVYSGNTLKEMLDDKKDPFWGARRLWLAQYGSTPKPQASWDKAWLWQYSDGELGPEPRDVKGISDYVDSNSFDGTPEELSAQWSGGNIPTPQPIPVVPEIVIIAPPGVKVTVKQQT